MEALVIPFEKLRMNDVEQVGGKNSSLGEMISQLADSGVRVPGGFATTAQAYRDFLAQSGLDKKINAALDALDVEDVNALAACGAEIRQWIMEVPFPMDLTIAITEQYQRLVADSSADMSFAVRSSATAEDLPDASFAGQQETFLNIVGLENILHAIKEVFASLYNDRAISYRVHKNFVHADVALSAGIQRMVRSDKGAAGVMFTLDTESGFRDAVFVTSSYGLGETVVQGAVNPDEFYVHKPMLAAGKKAVVRRNIGSKMIKMTFSTEKMAGKSVITEDVPEALRDQFSINDEEVMELARYAMIYRKALRSSDGHRVGQRRYRRQALHPSGAPGNRAVSDRCRKSREVQAQILLQSPRLWSCNRPEDWRRPGTYRQGPERDGSGQAR